MRRQTRVPRGAAAPPEAAAAGGADAARSASTRTAHVTLRWELVHDALKLTATTAIRSDSYWDSWWVSPSVPLRSATLDDASAAAAGRYVSRALVRESALAPDTTYTFSYAILMRTGASVWVGGCSLTLTVGPDRSLTPPPARPPRT